MTPSAIPTHALSLIEPWATLMIMGAKKNETRSWSTDYRGPLAIHASKKIDWETCREEPFVSVLQEHFGRWDFPFKPGHILGIVEMTDCRPTEELRPHQNALELDFGDFYDGRFGFVTDYPQALRNPIPARGMLNFWRLTNEQRDAIARELAV